MTVTLLDKWRVLQSVFADSRLSQSAKVVAGILLDCLNTSTGQCNPAVEFVEARSGLSRRSVTRALGELRQVGWIGQKRRRGTAIYTFDFGPDDAQDSAPHRTGDDAPEMAPQRLDEAQETAHLQEGDDTLKMAHQSDPDDEPEMAYQVAGDDAPEMAPLDAPKMACLDEPKMAHLYISRESETGNIPGKTISPAKPARRKPKPGPSETEVETAFREWWPHYPKRVDRGGARRVFGRLLKSGRVTLADLIAGADQYAADCRAKGTEARFTKGPERWLNAESWADEPGAAPSTTTNPSHRKDAKHDRAANWASVSYGPADTQPERGQIIEGDFRVVG